MSAKPSSECCFIVLCHNSSTGIAASELLARRHRNRRAWWLVQERDLPGVPGKPLPVHVDAMPTIQVNGLVIAMPHVPPRIYLGVANHAAPGHTARPGIGINQPVVLRLRDTVWIRLGNHDRDSEAPHRLFADMRLAATATAERLVPMDYPGYFMCLGRGNKEPLALPDRVPALDLSRAKTRNRGPYIVNAVTGRRGGKPVTLVAAEQELILVAAGPYHQHKMARGRLHIQNLGSHPVLTANVEKLAIAVPANVNSDSFSLPHTRPLHFQARAHTGEMPAQILFCGRHILLGLLLG